MVIRGSLAVERFLRKNAAARKPFNRWLAIATDGNWSSIVDMRRNLPTADAIKGTNLTCFNIGGNNYRLLAVVSFELQQIVIRDLMTHAQYNRHYGS